MPEKDNSRSSSLLSFNVRSCNSDKKVDNGIQKKEDPKEKNGENSLKEVNSKSQYLENPQNLQKTSASPIFEVVRNNKSPIPKSKVTTICSNLPKSAEVAVEKSISSLHQNISASNPDSIKSPLLKYFSS